MDAFAVAVSTSMATSRERVLRTALIYGAFFGTFQFFMPLIGFLLHTILPAAILRYSNVIAFALLFIVGARMIVGYFRSRFFQPTGPTASISPDDGESCVDKPISLHELVALSFATSIDALAAGTSLALIDVNILAAATVIGVVAFCMSGIGSLLGCKAAGFLRESEFLGGIVLVAIAVWVLLF